MKATNLETIAAHQDQLKDMAEHYPAMASQFKGMANRLGHLAKNKKQKPAILNSFEQLAQLKETAHVPH